MLNKPETPLTDKVATLTTFPLLIRLSVIGVVLLGVVASFVYAAGWLSPSTLTPARFIDAFEDINGHHPGFRRNHSKGVCVSGFFEGNGTGERLSRAIVFKAVRTPIIGRFALASGLPSVADGPSVVRSLAVDFKLPNGEEWRTGMNNIPVFAVRTPQGFYDLMEASRPDPTTGKPDPSQMQAFLTLHPETVQAMATIKAHPFSTGFDNASYKSLDAFRFINEAGVSTPVRWAMIPFQPYAAETKTTSANTDRNYLFEDLIAKLHRQPLHWHFIVTLGQAGDPTNDATLAWPPNREQVDVGTLTVTHIEAEDQGNCRDVNFDPLVLPSGIAPSDDPLLSARSAVYSQSVLRRDGETKQPSAVNVPPTTAMPSDE